MGAGIRLCPDISIFVESLFQLQENSERMNEWMTIKTILGKDIIHLGLGYNHFLFMVMVSLYHI